MSNDRILATCLFIAGVALVSQAVSYIEAHGLRALASAVAGH